MKIIVHLNPDEIRDAAAHGVNININAMSKRIEAKKPQRGRTNVPWWQDNIIGAIGEYAACKALGYPFDRQLRRQTQPDCGPYQIRSIESKDHGLLIRSSDNGDDPFILAQVSRFRVCLHGWMPGWIAREIGTPIFEDAIRLDIADLRSMDTIREWDDIDWSDEIGIYDPDARFHDYQDSLRV